MNLLAKVKLTNRYNYVTDSLYTQTTDEETQEVIYQPITDIDGDTALLTTDGTSWQFTDDEWVRIEQDLDIKILQLLYPFISSVCQSIHNSFVDYCTVENHSDITFSYKDNSHEIILVNGLSTKPDLVANDFVMIYTHNNNYLTKVIKNEIDNNDNIVLELDNIGVNIRVTGNIQNIRLGLVTFPPSFISTVLDMLGYDLFIRDNKEKRQERLGNYTYTNFETNVYNGDGAYPKQFESTIKYWQKINL